MADDDPPRTSDIDDTDFDVVVKLSSLLKALSEGVGACHGLPIGDEFEFQSSFPEFAAALGEPQSEVLLLLNSTFQQLDKHSNFSDDDPSHAEDLFHDFYDPAVWEKCSEVCDYLLEQIELEGNSSEPKLEKVQLLQQWGNRARSYTKSSYAQLMENVVDMEKPQDTYGIHPQNSRTEPFVPPITNKPNAIRPLDLTPVPGHGLDTRFPAHQGRLDGLMSFDLSQLVAPSTHVQHVYEAEIKELEYRDWQVDLTELKSAKIPQHSGPLVAIWVDKLEELEALVQLLDSYQSKKLVVAMDLEAHSWRSFSGLVCLMQLSFRIPHEEEDGNTADSIQNYLIDTLKLCQHMHLLLPVMTNPTVVKVFHGADSDILWLQRDFGLYVVNLFDTGRAARELELPSASYAHLLHKYVGITADKTYQLADWRQRPLSAAMQEYAIQDTHYLLDIYHYVKADLKTPDRIRKVLDLSKLVSLSRYAVEPFHRNGYKSMFARRCPLDDNQERILARLWDWRDRVARSEDESVNYVCPKKTLLRIAQAYPECSSLQGLQSLFNPLPPLILTYAHEILDILKSKDVNPITKSNPSASVARTETMRAVQGATDSGAAKLPTASSVLGIQSPERPRLQQTVGTFPSSAFLSLDSRSNMSPVLGTEALYSQAGWMTPHEKRHIMVDVSSTSGAGEDDDTAIPQVKPRRLLSVHELNKNYQSGKSAAEAGEGGEALGADYQGVSTRPKSRSVDGTGTVRAAMESPEFQDNHDLSIEEEMKMAKLSSSQVHAKLSSSLPSVLGLVTPTIDLDDDDAGVDDGRESRIRDGIDASEEDFPISRSMREIYKISNRNRRNKKAGSPTPERGVTPTTEKEQEELAKAEALLKELGLMPSAYFDDNSASPGKRPRTKASSGRESEETVPQDSVAAASREEDFDVIQSVGWLPEGTAMISREVGPDTDAGKHATYGFEFSPAGSLGAFDLSQSAPNPFFSGAALVGGPLTQGFGKPDQKAKKPSAGRGKQQGRRQERPEKKDVRTHVYRKR